MSSQLVRSATNTENPPQGQGLAQEQSTRVGHMSNLNIYSEADHWRRTSIICTIGPKTGTVEKLLELREAGMNIMRLNFSHGSYEFHGGLINNLRESCRQKPGSPVAIALDTKGPEIRTGMLAAGDVKLEKGHIIKLHTNEEWYEKGTATDIYIDYKNITKVTNVGSIIYVDDGLMSFKVKEIDGDVVTCEVENGGLLGGRKGCNLPNIKVDLPALSEKDKKDLKWGVEQGIDMIFASFIRKAADVLDIRACLGEAGKNVKIISKIENHEGVRNFAEILAVTDGVMVARGDLGIEIAPEKVFLAQKMMISMCNIQGKPVICATQMLESMTYNPRPTRAEVSDVANAVLDGADCVMLSGETAKGDYPVETVMMMSRVCCEAESAFYYKALFNDLRNLNLVNGPNSTTETVALAAVEASFDQRASAIVVLSTTGNTARLVSKYRPKCPIFMCTRDAVVARQSHLYRGVYPMHYGHEESRAGSFQDDVDSRIEWVIKEAKSSNYITAGNTVIVIQGWRGGIGHTNTMRVLTIE